MKRALAALLIVSGSVLGWSTAAVDAATVADSGWWDRNANDLLPTLDPPPEGALRVANDPTGTSAVSAVRFQLDEGEEDPMLTLRVVGDPVPEGAAFVACPTTSEWEGASGAPITEAPEADCDAGQALGLVAGDATSVSFDLAQIARADTVAILISPSPTGESPVTDTFAVDFEAPAASDVTTGGPLSPGPAAPGGTSSGGGGGGGAASPAVGSGTSGGSPSFAPSSPGSSSGSFTSPASPSVTVPGAGGGAPTTTIAGGTSPVTTSIDGEVAVAPPLDDVSSSSKRWIGLATAAAIIGIGIYLWRADRAKAVMTAGPVVGGLGPFVRERSGPAPDVT